MKVRHIARSLGAGLLGRGVLPGLLILVSTLSGGQPTAPSRVILTFAGDPSTSQAVTWRTAGASRNARGQIAVASADPRFVRNARNVAAQSQQVKGGSGTVHYHTVNFTNLKPRTQYAYRVGDGSTWTEWSHFWTASEKADPFSFIYVGDAQTDIKSLWSRAIRGAFREAPKARFIIHAGDLVDNGNSDSQWGEWFHAAGWINMMIPSVATPGNHEYAGGFSRFWRPQFAFPRNGPPNLLETTYFFDYQGVRFISLNSNERIGEQVAWLDAVLSKNPHRWSIVTFHHPVFSTAKGRDNAHIRKAWMPVFDKHRVDLVLQGHDHGYGRTGNVKAGVNVERGGTVYVVSVSGSKMYSIDKDPRMEKMGGNLQLYQIISLNGDTLSYQARTVTGEVFDSFRLVKGEDGNNRMER